jgi:uncharacterized RDD family membrane protein YckC
MSTDTPGRRSREVLTWPGVRPAELERRLGARLIDDVILFLINLSVLILIIAAALGLSDGAQLSPAVTVAIRVATGVLGSAIYVGYFALFESRRGQTIGKMVFKLHTVGAQGGLPTWREAARRNLFMAFPLLAIIPGIGGLLALLAAFSAATSIGVSIGRDIPLRQGWHDRFAGGTRVVRVR